MAPGDVFIMNDPFDGGMHLPDIFIFKPLYHEGERLAFACTVCHHTDVGGRVAGSNASDSTEIYAEGPAHRADEALRGGQAQPDHHDVHREERPPAGAGVRRPARAACRLPHRREAVRRDRRALRAGADQVLSEGNHRLCGAADARRAARAARRRMELRGLDRRRRHRLRQADPPVRHHPQDRRPHGGRLDRHQPAGERRDQQHALLHQGRRLHRRALGAAARHSRTTKACSARSR